MSTACQDNPPQTRIAASSSKKALSLSSDRIMNRRPSREYASAVKSSRPVESICDEQPQLKPALLRLSAMISQHFTLIGLCLFCAPHSNDEIKGSRSVDFRRSGMASVVHPTNANERVAALGVVRALPTRSRMSAASSVKLLENVAMVWA